MGLREELRTAIDSCGIKVADLEREDFKRLALKMNQAIKRSDDVPDGFRVSGRIQMKELSAGRQVKLFCSSYYFEKREAVSFYADGFVGIAGWADDKNVSVLAQGISEWVTETAPRLRHQPEISPA